MKNTNVLVSLDTRRAKKDGSYPLVLRIGHKGRTTAASLGISLLEKDWDDAKKLVRKSYAGVDGVTRLNNLIQKKKAAALDMILKLHEAGVLAGLSVTELRERIAKQDTSDSFLGYAERQVMELVVAGRIGTARSYQGVIAVLRRFTGGKDLAFSQVTYGFLSRFETAHRSKGNGVNGLAVYLRTIRAIYNKAIKEGLADREAYPFAEYRIKTAPTEKRALDWGLLKQVIDLSLEPSHPCFNARNLFLASYMMYGMNFTDMAYLKKADLKDGRLLYRRRKTSKLYDIKVTENLAAILSHYGSRSQTDYMFPILKRTSPLHQAKDIQWARKRYNAKLKDLAKLCGIDKPLTSYVSRHSFATQAMLKQIPINAISAMLGHSSLKTTEVYLKSLPSDILDTYNSQITDLT